VVKGFTQRLGFMYVMINYYEPSLPKMNPLRRKHIYTNVVIVAILGC
jgi:hypothetical protein